MQENLINTKIKEIYYNLTLETKNDSETDAINKFWKMMNIYALQNYNYVQVRV